MRTENWRKTVFLQFSISSSKSYRVQIYFKTQSGLVHNKDGKNGTIPEIDSFVESIESLNQ